MPKGDELRRLAEQMMPEKSAVAGSPDTKKLLHELQVHQIELEMQNEALLAAQQHAEESLQRYTELYDYAPAAYFTVLRDSTIVQANIAATSMLGLERSRLKGARLESFLIPGEREKFQIFLAEAFQTESNQRCEARLLVAKKSRPVCVVLETIVGHSGEESHIVITDISELKQSEAALRENQEKYSTLVESANDGVVIMQEEIFKFCNRAMVDITGYSLDELLGMSALDLVDTESRKLISEVSRMLLAGQQPPVTCSVKFICKDGQLKDVELSSIKLSKYEGRPAVIAMFRDVTVQKRAQDEISRLVAENRMLSRQLMQSQEDEQRYIARELHDEMGQSLTAIDTFSKLISMKSKDEWVIDKANEISKITSKLFKGVRSLLARIRPPALDSVGLSAALQNLTSQWMRSSGIVCTLNISGTPDDFPEIVNIAIYRILQESLTNISRHAIADQVEVTLSRVAPEQDQAAESLQLEIRDNGKGMNLEKARVMGLGMVGIRERVHALGGSCVFDSSPGQGMHTLIVIPRVEKEDGLDLA